MYVLLVTASHIVSNGAQGHLAKKVGSVRSYAFVREEAMAEGPIRVQPYVAMV